MKKVKVVNKGKFITSILIFTAMVTAMTMILFGGNNVYSTKYEDEYIEVKIVKGNTLWDIALNNQPRGYDTRDMVYEIMSVNNLKDAKIKPGDVIKVPIREKK